MSSIYRLPEGRDLETTREARKSALIGLIDKIRPATEQKSQAQTHVFDPWRTAMKNFFGLHEDSSNQFSVAAHQVVTNGRMYLILQQELEGLSQALCHNFREVLELNNGKWSILPRWWPRNLFADIQSFGPREEWHKELTIRFAEIESKGMRYGLKEDEMGAWRKEAKETFLITVDFKELSQPYLARAESISLSKAKTEEEYDDLLDELDKFSAEFKHNTKPKTRSIDDRWKPEEIRKIVEQHLKFGHPRLESPSRVQT